ncbi:alpha-aminoadipic semialdehyde synthase [Achlya hypogyna]|uniref:Alpha-aminoadipic semialdehyde synthase n=1 Tax=Achlya hypogyna TaxID=1202772 RepID=A0A1V9YHU9_ACHHY|nr:alpha-aminoadipic semialdehyde synthase [Achlya hypogyna]
MDTRADLDAIIEKIQALGALTRSAEATVKELPDYCMGSYNETLSQRPDSAKEGAGMTFQGSVSVANAKERKKIVCLGAGLVASPLVEYLTRDANHSLTVVSGLAGEADAMAAKYKHRSVTAATVDVGKQADTVASLVAAADCVVSLLPAPMHVNIAKSCLVSKTPLVTASYISPEMQALHEAAVASRIPILCELGLDPGMDHMSAMKIIDEVQAQQGRVVSFSSVCGGLPAPEAADNPIAYKFSWSPRGVLTAALNSAQYLKNGKLVQIDGENLLTSAERVNFLPAFALEQIPNRNSLPYAQVYNIPDAESIFRGTLRYAGNCAIMHQCRLLGLLNTAEETLPATWPALISQLKSRMSSRLSPDAEAFLVWLGLDDPAAFVDPSAKSTIDAFCALLTKKLSYLPGERDMAIMHHEFDVEFADRRELITSTYVGYGDSESTVMAKTVGMSAAIGVDLILRGDVAGTGVLTPTTPDIYTPGLARLEAEGIRFVEKTRVLPKKA